MKHYDGTKIQLSNINQETSLLPSLQQQLNSKNMKQAIHILFAILLTLAATTTTAFSPSVNSAVTRSTSTELNLFGFGEKDDGSPGDYVCKDCGYVFTKGPAAWAKLDNDKYACPPCGAPKFRFNKVPKGSASGKVEVKKSWFGN